MPADAAIPPSKVDSGAVTIGRANKAATTAASIGQPTARVNGSACASWRPPTTALVVGDVESLSTKVSWLTGRMVDTRGALRHQSVVNQDRYFGWSLKPSLRPGSAPAGHARLQSRDRARLMPSGKPGNQHDRDERQVLNRVKDATLSPGQILSQP